MIYSSGLFLKWTSGYDFCVLILDIVSNTYHDDNICFIDLKFKSTFHSHWRHLLLNDTSLVYPHFENNSITFFIIDNLLR